MQYFRLRDCVWQEIFIILRNNSNGIMKIGRTFPILLIMMLTLVAVGCGNKRDNGQSGARGAFHRQLQTELEQLVSKSPGEIGVAVIVNGETGDQCDTIVVNDGNKYPMMSVFKLHQAVALCHKFDAEGISLDTVVCMKRDSLDPDTWSPMLKDYDESEICLPVRRLLEYTLQLSDNNASNEMFRQLMPPADCDRYIATLVPRNSFRILYSEESMKRDHSLAYSNHTSPLGAASLIHRLYTDSILSQEKQLYLQETLLHCGTGVDRISEPLQSISGIKIGHKTGSGYRNERGELVAHNGVAFIQLPDGSGYSLAVLVKDFPGTEAEASAIIARISQTVYESITNH